jgi:hypothetical protein
MTKRKTARETNGEGLTWPEWWRATLLNPQQVAPIAQELLAAWRANKNPTEYAAALR